MSLMTLVLLLALKPPLAASADLPSLARVGFFLIFSIKVDNWLGIMDGAPYEHVGREERESRDVYQVGVASKYVPSSLRKEQCALSGVVPGAGAKSGDDRL